METLRRLMPWNEDGGRNHPFWRKTCNAWCMMVFPRYTLTDPRLEITEWNPWKNWCKSWEEFVSSKEKPPKSEKQKAAMFSQLSTVAKSTSDKLEKAKTDMENKTIENENLKKQITDWHQAWEKLHHELNAERRLVVDYQKSLNDEVNLKKSLEAQKVNWIYEGIRHKEELQEIQAQCREHEKKCVKLQCELDYWRFEASQHEKDVVEYKNSLKKEVNLRKSLEAQKASMRDGAFKLEEEREEVQAQCRELEKTCSSLKARCRSQEEALSSLRSQLVEFSKHPTYQQIIFNRNTFVTPPNQWSQQPLYPQLENGEGEKMLDLDTIRDIVARLGPVTSSNVFDWLCNCEEEYKFFKWTEKDFQQILRRCMDCSNFASLPTMEEMTELSWHQKCQYIAETFIPHLHHSLDTERMREDDTVLKYLNRMWMIYRVTDPDTYVSKEDCKFKNAICKGLLPRFYHMDEQIRHEEYGTIELSFCCSERSMSESEKKRRKERKAGAGCPSRMKIWMRLQKYPIPYDEINEVSYWDLLVQLSRYEDLETGEPI